MPDSIEKYLLERDIQAKENTKTSELETASRKYMESLVKANYIKSFTWAGVPIIQLPQDLMAIQEIIWTVKPDIIIETGIAWGGSLLFYANILNGIGSGEVLGIDIEIREHTYEAIRENPLRNRINLFESDSTDEKLIKSLQSHYHGKKVLVLLDSNHTHSHVLQELNLYSTLVSIGSYLIANDTAIEFYGHLDKNQDRAWGKGNNPYTAVQEFLKHNDNFVVDHEIEKRAVITSAIGGWLKRIK